MSVRGSAGTLQSASRRAARSSASPGARPLPRAVCLSRSTEQQRRTVRRRVRPRSHANLHRELGSCGLAGDRAEGMEGTPAACLGAAKRVPDAETP